MNGGGTGGVPVGPGGGGTGKPGGGTAGKPCGGGALPGGPDGGRKADGWKSAGFVYPLGMEGGRAGRPEGAGGRAAEPRPKPLGTWPGPAL